MELQPELIEKLGLNEDQTKEISNYYGTKVSDLKKEWDGVANENAEKIIGGAINSTITEFGLDIQRQEGEKNKDFLSRVNKSVFNKEKETLSALKADYEQKLKDFKGGDALKSELDATKAKLDDALQKAAQFDEWSEADYKGKYESTQNDYNALKQRLAFSQSLPKFSNDVNQYELKAKVEEVQKAIEDKYHIEFDENNEAIAIDKENKHKVQKLSVLIEGNELIKSLTDNEYTPNGLGSNVSKVDIEGLPFQINPNSSSKEKIQAIREHLNTKYGSSTADGYSKDFEKYYKLIKEKTPH